MGLLSALGRWAKAIGYLLTGRVDQARKAIDANPHVMNAKYDEMIRTMQGKITQYVNAASTVSAHVARKENELARTLKEIEETERFRTGAVTIAKQVAAKLQAAGKDPASDPEYAQHRAAFNDFSSTLGEKLKTKKELEDAIAAGQETNRNHLFTLKNLKRELETLKKEKGEMVAEMISATQERQLNEMLSGLESNTNDIMNERTRMKEAVSEAKAAAKITGQVAGTDAKRAQQEYLDVAMRTASNSEFDSLVGISAPAPAPALEAASSSNVLDVQVITPQTESVRR